MHVDERGHADARPVLLVHGGGVAGWMWRPLVDELTQRRCLVPDLPGHDHSSDEPYRDHASTVDALARVVEARAKGPVDVVGFSLGAQLGVMLASLRPELVASVTVISAQARPMRATRALVTMVGATSALAGRTWFARLQARELFVPDASFEDYLRTARSISRDTLVTSVRENLQFRVPAAWSQQSGAPALVLVGAKERRVMLDSARGLHRSRPGTQLEVVPGRGHGLPLQDPVWLAQRLQGWWQSGQSGRPGATSPDS